MVGSTAIDVFSFFFAVIKKNKIRNFNAINAFVVVSVCLFDFLSQKCVDLILNRLATELGEKRCLTTSPVDFPSFTRVGSIIAFNKHP